MSYLELLDNKIQLGLHRNLSSEDYHGHKESISRSALMDFDRSPYHFHAKRMLQVIKEPTRSMTIGTAFHMLMLEPGKFYETYAVEPEKVLLKDVGREKYDEYKAKCAELAQQNKSILSTEEYETLLKMQERFKSNETAMQFLDSSNIEHSFFWQDESGLILKCRPDIYHSNIIVDIKTCADASPRAYQSEMIKYGYHLQGAMVQDGLYCCDVTNEYLPVLNICIETQAPYAMGLYLLDDLALEAGRLKYKSLCHDLAIALRENKWQDFGVQKIGLPRWAI